MRDRSDSDAGWREFAVQPIPSEHVVESPPLPSAPETEVRGVVIARVCNEQISIKCENGCTVSFRARWPLSAQLELGQRAVVVIDGKGRAQRARPATKDADERGL